jgi:hypothetical protein
MQNKVLGSAVLKEAEKWVGKTPWPAISMYFHSPRSVVNGIPAFKGEVLTFFTKRGYYIKKQVAGAYINTPCQFCFDAEKIEEITVRNKKDGYTLRSVSINDHDYFKICEKSAAFCATENRQNKNWLR